jgi:hypothetical protein
MIEAPDNPLDDARESRAKAVEARKLAVSSPRRDVRLRFLQIAKTYDAVANSIEDIERQRLARGSTG